MIVAATAGRLTCRAFPLLALHPEEIWPHEGVLCVPPDQGLGVGGHLRHPLGLGGIALLTVQGTRGSHFLKTSNPEERKHLVVEHQPPCQIVLEEVLKVILQMWRKTES